MTVAPAARRRLTLAEGEHARDELRKRLPDDYEVYWGMFDYEREVGLAVVCPGNSGYAEWRFNSNNLVETDWDELAVATKLELSE
jgi:hypothetical protein